MLLALDVGNTETTIGLFDRETLAAHWRLRTTAERTADELAVLLLALVARSLPARGRVSAVALCSVVPPATQSVVDACDLAFAVSPLVVSAASGLPISLDVDEPTLVGADRVVNTLAVRELYQRDAIVVDLGTATTYDCVTAEGSFFGGVIQPGIRSSAETLVRKTSMLPATALAAPARAIGKNTVDNIKAGVVFGAADAIDGLVRRIKGEWPRPATPFVVATGGLAESFRTLCSELDEVQPALTLQGLRLAHRHLTLGRP